MYKYTHTHRDTHNQSAWTLKRRPVRRRVGEPPPTYTRNPISLIFILPLILLVKFVLLFVCVCLYACE